jgi:predicted ATPase/DNA-binding SARP family transcriptional activator
MPPYARVLGSAVVRDGDQVVEPAPSLRMAVFFHLVGQPGWTPRDELAGIFWGDRPDAVARANLRQQLFQLRRSPLGTAIEVQRERVRFLGDSDVAAFRGSLARRDWAAALEVWHGPFLAGWAPTAQPAVDAWIEASRRELGAGWHRAVVARADQLEQAGRLVEAAELHGTLWRADVLDHVAVAEQLRLHALAGRPDLAARAADAYRTVFATELEVEPDGPLAELLDAAAAPPDRTTIRPARAAPRRPPPAPTTPLVGRERERATVASWLAQGRPRAIALVGLGGAGKTRLAAELLRDARERGRDGAWVALALVDHDDDVDAALADAWGVEDPAERNLAGLTRRIGAARAVLVLDQAEHVLGGVRRATRELLERCPHLVVVTTSRRAPGSPGERRVAIGGLDTRVGPDGSDAARLLRAHARAIDASFDAGTDPDVLEEIARQVDGHPLALELVASWADVLRPLEVLDALRDGLSLVRAAEGDGAGGPDLAGILDETVERLPGDARDAYLRLAPFRGGFDLAAARAVGVAPVTLRALTRASLATRDHGRFERHPLVVRHAAQRAAERSDVAADARERHARHFLDRLAATEPTLTSRVASADAAALLRDEPANVREALVWVVEHAPPVEAALAHLHYVLLRRDLGARPDVELSRRLAQRADAELREHLRWNDVDLAGMSEHEGARAEELRARSAVELARSRGDRVLLARSLIRWGKLRLRADDPPEALRLFRRAARELRLPSPRWRGRDQLFRAQAFALAGVAQHRRGAYGAARHDHLRAVAVARGVGDLALEELDAVVVTDLLFGRYDAALKVASAMLRCTPVDAPPAVTIRVLGLDARARIARGDLVGARSSAERRLALAHRLDGDTRPDRIQASHSVLGLVAILEGDLPRAEAHLQRSGDHHVDVTRRAQLALEAGDPDRALALAEAALATLAQLGSPPARPLERALATAVRLEAVRRRHGGDHAVLPTSEALRWATETRLPTVVLQVLLPASRILDQAGDPTGRDLLRRIATHPAAEYGLRRQAERATDPRSDGTSAVRGLESLRIAAEAALAAADRSGPRRTTVTFD